MLPKRCRPIRGLIPLVLLVTWSTAEIAGQRGAIGEWRTYGGDLASTRYSTLDQITPLNFKDLEIAWRFRTDILGPRPDFNLQTTPLMVNGVLYATAGSRRNVVAIDGATGELLWTFRFDEGRRAETSPRRRSGRGVGYWTDGRDDERIFHVSIGYQLVGLNPKTGLPITAFGEDGIVDLRQDMDQVIDPLDADIALNTGPIVAKDMVIVGAAHKGGNTKSYGNTKGYVRAFDVRTGERRWIFHTIPQPGEFGNDTWENDSWSYVGNTSVWAPMSVDEELGLVYLPVESPTSEYYGGHRPGDNLFGDSLVAVELQTGKRVWHYQFIHHGIWDYDTPCAPILADITVGGREIRAIAQPTKMGWVYVLDRQTGEPVWPIEERPVPQSGVPGERTSPTQPFPTNPPAFERQGTSVDELIDFTPELRAEAIKVASRFKLGPIYTPPIVRDERNGLLGVLMLPGVNGGANWPGGAYDPETGMLYVHSSRDQKVLTLAAAPEVSESRYVDANYLASSSSASLFVQGLPLFKPPWGTITAIDLNKAEIAWQVAHGDTPDEVRNHPALKGITIPRTGRPGRIGPLATKTLVIAGEPGFVTTSSGQRGAMLRPYEKPTGREVGAVYMPAPQTGPPMTYMLNGRQYIVLGVSGGTHPAELIAYALPSK